MPAHGLPAAPGHRRDGLLTCHWHHARFDLARAARSIPSPTTSAPIGVEIRDGDVVVLAGTTPTGAAHLYRRLEEGLEQGITLVIAKAVLGLLEARRRCRATSSAAGVELRHEYRASGWGPGLTVLVAMANVLAVLDPADRALALVHGLAFVSSDTGAARRASPSGRSTRRCPLERLTAWYRRFIDTRIGRCGRARRSPRRSPPATVRPRSPSLHDARP